MLELALKGSLISDAVDVINEPDSGTPVAAPLNNEAIAAINEPVAAPLHGVRCTGGNDGSGKD